MQPNNPYEQQTPLYPTTPNPYGPAGPTPLTVSQPSGGKPIGLIIALFVSIVLLFGSIGFGFWAFAGRQDYKDNVDKKIAAGVEAASQKITAEKELEYLEREKNPYKQYVGPATFGSVRFDYPKTWSAFISENAVTNSKPIEGYLHPNIVPALQSGTDFALRLEVMGGVYENNIKTYESMAKQGKVKITPFKLDKVQGVLGARIEGEINKGQNDSMVILPLRDKTIKVWTESQSFLNDFDKIVLPSFSYEP